MARAERLIVEDYARVGADGAQLRVPRRKRKGNRSRAQQAAEYRYRRAGKAAAKDARRRARKTAASAGLTAADHLRINAIYAEAARRTAETGVVHHVDHDVPLARGGKHHPDNLLIVPAKVNLVKGTRTMQEFLGS